MVKVSGKISPITTLGKDYYIIVAPIVKWYNSCLVSISSGFDSLWGHHYNEEFTMTIKAKSKANGKIARAKQKRVKAAVMKPKTYPPLLSRILSLFR